MLGNPLTIKAVIIGALLAIIAATLQSERQEHEHMIIHSREVLRTQPILPSHSAEEQMRYEPK